MNAANRSPRILIDGLFFQVAHTGIARVWTSLLREWAANGFGEHLLFIDRGDTAPRIDGIQYRTIPHFDHRVCSDEAILLQTLCDEEQADVFISTYYTAPLTTPSVFMAYDMIPEVYGHAVGPMWREKHYGLQHASAHVAISHNTARDLLKFFPEVRSDSMTVAYPGVDAAFHPAAGDEINQFRERYCLQKPYFLLVGSRAGFNGYKNALLFFRAFAALPEGRRFAVVCIGSEPLEPALQPFARDAEIRLLQVNDDDLRAAYSGAVSLVYPSCYEGFGLPVLEAMSCGCPVITCRNSSLPEVAGGAALYVPENDPAVMTTALQRVQDDTIRRAMIAAGLIQAAKFSWRDMAATLEDVMRRTANDRRPLRIWVEFRQLQLTARDLMREREERKQPLRQPENHASESNSAYIQMRNALTQKSAELEQTRDALSRTERELSELKELLAYMGVAAPARRG